MNYVVYGYAARRPELTDIEALYKYKNNPIIAGMLAGFSTGYSSADITDWIEHHRQCKDEVVWAIADAETDLCFGHVGLYQIDFRIRMAQFGIMIGNPDLWGKGLGRAFTAFALDYGFDQLNLNRIHLTVVPTNERALRLYRSLGFREEGRLRQAQYKDGQYLDLFVMSILRADYLHNQEDSRV